MHGSVVRPYPLLPPRPIVVLRGGMNELCLHSTLPANDPRHPLQIAGRCIPSR